MNRYEKKYFRQIKKVLVDISVYSPADDFTIQQAAEVLHKRDKAKELVDKAGQIQSFKTGARQISPEINNWRGLNQDFLKYAALLGLTPVARLKLNALEKKEEQPNDPLQGLRKVV